MAHNRWMIRLLSVILAFLGELRPARCCIQGQPHVVCSQRLRPESR